MQIQPENGLFPVRPFVLDHHAKLPQRRNLHIFAIRQTLVNILKACLQPNPGLPFVQLTRLGDVLNDIFLLDHHMGFLWVGQVFTTKDQGSINRRGYGSDQVTGFSKSLKT